MPVIVISHFFTYFLSNTASVYNAIFMIVILEHRQETLGIFIIIEVLFVFLDWIEFFLD